jgi:hypothetical protein
MEKQEIKAQIERLKGQLVREKEKWKQLNETHKRVLADLARQASLQTSKSGRDTVKMNIATKKQLWEVNEKRFEREAYARIKADIERLKERLKGA